MVIDERKYFLHMWKNKIHSKTDQKKILTISSKTGKFTDERKDNFPDQKATIYLVLNKYNSNINKERKMWSLTTMVNGPGVKKDLPVIELYIIIL